MKNENKEVAQASATPVVVKYLQPFRGGIQAHNVARHSIGFIRSGRKHIYYGDSRKELVAGDLFYLGIGNHYFEDIPDGDKPFEQISFFYSPETLASVLMTLNLTYNYRIDASLRHRAISSDEPSCISCVAWPTVRNFFGTISHYMRDEQFMHDHTAHNIKFVELIYLILNNEDCPMRSRILESTDTLAESFEQTIHRHIFENISIEELSSLCHRSLTSFKKEFRRHFDMPPHRWLTRQRLLQARLLLISTSKSVSEIGNDCNIPNTSHFIKLFKKEYGTTPALYRQRNGGAGEVNTNPDLHSSEVVSEEIMASAH